MIRVIRNGLIAGGALLLPAIGAQQIPNHRVYVGVMLWLIANWLILVVVFSGKEP